MKNPPTNPEAPKIKPSRAVHFVLSASSFHLHPSSLEHGDWGKWLVLRLARQTCGLSVSELGEEAGGSDYAAVSVGLGRFDKRLKADRALRSAYEQAKQISKV